MASETTNSREPASVASSCSHAKRRPPRRWMILVVWNDGEEEYVADASGKAAQFTSRSAAEETAGLAGMGLDGEVQSINVVIRRGR